MGKVEKTETGMKISFTNYKSITIFSIGAGKDGQSTLRFNDIFDYTITEDRIRFEYISASDKQYKVAVFFLKNISGYSLEEG